MENTQALEMQPGGETKEQRIKDPIVRSLLRVFWILLVVTIVEISLAFLYYFTSFPPRMLLNIIFICLTVVKAFYIIGEFMHLRHEVSTLIKVFLIPLLLLLWAITAFLWDGNSWKHMRERDRSDIQATVPWQTVKHQNE
ncbi:MAG: hypothetical protein EPN39_17320 [Chitinophagaceae bacterium]|jgi:cytochrome c oxidase subunit IV|nr:MAG: hypothetical protein EPN39_17320 [Chitinophagaceae bacterium]